ncbi:MAG: hypothetical protein EB127_01270 [Alphaproteobacteria bacterium]|nr:hypothetical protein [Alphaproteobacteria bacterium]
MRTVSQQIGWSQEAKLLYEIQRELDYLYNTTWNTIVNPTTTTTTTITINSVQIGTQRWTSENLMQTTFLNGDAITLATNSSEWYNYVYNNTPCYAFRDFDANNFNEGLFYNIYALRDSRGLGYVGWRIPNIDDKDILKGFVTDAYPTEQAWTLKSTTSWTTANGTDRYGFNAKALGVIGLGGFGYYGTNAIFALSNSNFTEQAMFFDTDQEIFQFLWSGYNPEEYGINVRLIQS